MKMKFRLLLALVFIGTLMINSCQQKEQLRVGEGYINVDSGKVWYNVVGNGNKTPIIILHGGPGVPSYYLKPLKALGFDRKLIFYDQLGCGKSDHITDTTLMTINHFVEELRTVVKYFNLKEFYLYGHSWGTMLAMDYYLKYPQDIKALILNSPSLSIPMWVADADSLLSTLPDSIQNAVRTSEQNKSYDAPEYQQAVMVFYQNYLARKQPWSADLDSTFSQIGESYEYMCGPSEFTLGQLGKIKVPILFIAGEFDEAVPSTVRYYQSLVPGAKFKLIRGAAHLTMQDRPDQTNKAISDFIESLETE